MRATRPSQYLRKALELRLQVQQAELAAPDCDTAAKKHCVSRAIADTRRQLGELARRRESGVTVR